MNNILRWLVHANRKVLIPFAICMGFSLLVCIGYWLSFDSLVKLDTYQLNMNVTHGVKAKVDPRLFFLAIDRNSYLGDIGSDEAQNSEPLSILRGTFPWPRQIWADVIERLMQAHARMVILDLLFPGPKDGDDQLKAVLDKYADRIVIGSNFQYEQGASGEQVSQSTVLTLPSPSLLGTGDQQHVDPTDERIGFVNMWPDDEDQIIRRAHFYQTAETASALPPPKTLPQETPGVMYSLSARVAKKLDLENNLPDSWDGQLIRFCGPTSLTFPRKAIYEIFTPDTWANNFQNGEFFRDKIVLVGPFGDWAQDEHQTPFPQLMAGPEIHLSILSAILQKSYLHEMPRRLSYVLIILAGILAFIETRLIPNPYIRMVVGLFTVLVFGAISFLSYNYFNRYLLIMSPAVNLFGALVLTFVYEVVQEQYERSRMRGVLDRYMSKDLVKDVLDNPNSYFNTVGGVRKPITVLFSDVRGFTTMAEGADPSDLVKQLNEYLAEMVHIVFHNKGTLDKFIGDAVMAVWGNVVSGGTEVDAARAVRAALEMRAGLAKLNVGWRERGIMELAFGIGINHGDVVVGNVGSEQKMEITVIGDAVNLASRLESLTKEYHLDLLIGENVAALVEKDFYLQLADNVRVKGKSKPVRVYAVLGERHQDINPVRESFLRIYHTGIELYQQGRFAEARPYFEEALSVIEPNDLAKIYLDRCDVLIENPPEVWDGVYVMTKK